MNALFRDSEIQIEPCDGSQVKCIFKLNLGFWLVFLNGCLLSLAAFYVLQMEFLRPHISGLTAENWPAWFAFTNGLLLTFLCSTVIYFSNKRNLALRDNMRIQAENQLLLQQKTEYLEQTNTDLEDLTFLASHDLREPLRGIREHSEFILEEHRDRLDSYAVRRLHRQIFLCRRMSKLVDDLLNYSWLGKQALNLEEHELATIIEEVKDLLECSEMDTTLTILCDNHLPTLCCDRAMVTELYRNLFSNALRYNHNEDKQIKVGCLPFAAYRNQMIQNVMYVEDNGLGIPEEQQSAVFQLFRQFNPTAQHEHDNTGAGLSFVKKIVERHGGIIWFESHPGSGTTFYFTLSKPEIYLDGSKAA